MKPGGKHEPAAGALRRRASPTSQASAHQLARERLMPTTTHGTRTVSPFTVRLLQPGRYRSPCWSYLTFDGPAAVG
jgi:hypothetical protein